MIWSAASHRILVMLDDDQRIAQVAQPHERANQPGVVALMQADARLVQHVEHAHQARANLRRQPDALRLAAGERRRRAVHRQIIEANIHQEAQPRPNLFQNLAANQPLALGQRLDIAQVVGTQRLQQLQIHPPVRLAVAAIASSCRSPLPFVPFVP